MRAKFGARETALSALQNPILEVRVEAICELGCRLVRQTIDRLEDGESVPETADLDAPEQDWVLSELKSIMAVYGDSCRIS